MLCSEFEIRLCEYLDGALDAAARRAVEQHASECRGCAALLADSRAFGAFLERTPAVEAPPELVTSVLYRTQMGSPAWRAATESWRARLHGVLQPRFAMSMAMTILSVSMLYRMMGLEVRQLSAADLNPVRIWRSVSERAQQAWTRGVKVYQNLRFLYEVQSQLRNLPLGEEAAREPAETPAPKNPPEAREEAEP
jgi:anti-sigma factor RsiW